MQDMSRKYFWKNLCISEPLKEIAEDSEPPVIMKEKRTTTSTMYRSTSESCDTTKEFSMGEPFLKRKKCYKYIAKNYIKQNHYYINLGSKTSPIRVKVEKDAAESVKINGTRERSNNENETHHTQNNASKVPPKSTPKDQFLQLPFIQDTKKVKWKHKMCSVDNDYISDSEPTNTSNLRLMLYMLLGWAIGMIIISLICWFTLRLWLFHYVKLWKIYVTTSTPTNANPSQNGFIEYLTSALTGITNIFQMPAHRQHHAAHDHENSMHPIA